MEFFRFLRRLTRRDATSAGRESRRHKKPWLQVEPLEARWMLANKIWTGAVDATWSNASNWIGGVPGSGDVAVFDTTQSGTNVNSTIDAGFAGSVAGIQMLNYAGTITDSLGSLTVGASGITENTGVINANGKNVTVNGPTTIGGGKFQAGNGSLTLHGALTVSGGTFAGSGGNVTVSGNLTINSGGTLVAPSGTLQVQTLINNATFMPNGGTVAIEQSGTFSVGVSGTSPVPFYNLLLDTGGSISVNDDISVAGTLSTQGPVFTSGNTTTLVGSGRIGTSGLFSFGNLTVAPGADATAGTGFGVFGTMTVGAGATFTPVAGAVISGPTLTGTGTILVTRTGTNPDLPHQFAFTTLSLANMTVDYAGTGPQNVTSAASSFRDLLHTGSGSLTLQSGVTLSGNLINACATFSLAPQQTLATGNRPAAVVLADVNGDGKPDLVVANGRSASVSVLLGNGDGTFQAQRTLAVISGYQPYSLAVGDVNGDGKPDLVVGTSGLFVTMEVLLGNGDGTFQTLTPKTFTTGTKPLAPAIADVNGDGKPDLIVTDYNSGTVSVLLGNGDGSFRPPQTFAVGTHPNSVAVADVNHDGKPDLVTANGGDRTLSLLFGVGDGSFQPAQTLGLGSAFPHAVAAADVNGDGKPDLVVGTTTGVGIWLGNGDGSFQSEHTFGAAVTSYRLLVADLNGDGKPDVAVADDSRNDLSVLLGNGDGSFQAPTTFALSSNAVPIGVAAADVNGDGKIDLVVGDGNVSNSAVSLFLNSGIPAAAAIQPQHTFAAGALPFSVAVADVNGDGKPDLITANYFGGSVGVEPGNGDGTFQAQHTFAVGNLPTSVKAADVNGDGKPDLVVTNTFDNTVSVLLGNGDGSFQAQKTFAASSFRPMFSYAHGAYSVAVADVNGDGKPDLVVASPGYLHNSSYIGTSVSVLLGNGDGTFQSAQTLAAGNLPVSVAVVDVNGDGKPDLVTGNFGSNNVGVFLGNGDGTFQAQQTLAAGNHTRSVAAADVNGDGKPDLLVTNNGSNNVGVFLGNGDGTFRPEQTFATGNGPSSVVVADVNGDGRPDLAIANTSDNSIAVLLGNGDGSFQPRQTYTVGSFPRSVAVADLNGDGKPDVVTANFSDSTVSVLLNAPQAAGTLNANNQNITLGGSWTNTATFQAGTGTVTFNGSNQTVSGNTTFFNLNKTVAAADTLTFQAGSNQTVTNNLTLQGASGQLLKLRSASPGTQWIIDPTGTRNVSFVDVQDSNNTSGTLINPASSTDSGDNTNWFNNITSSTWTGSVNTNWSNASNWSNGVPTASVNATIPNVGNLPVLSQASATNNLTIQAGASVTLASHSFTVGGTFSNLGTLILQGSEPVSLTQDTIEGTWEYVGDGFGQAVAIKEFGATDYFNLVIDDTHASPDTFTDLSGHDLGVAGAFTVSAGGYNANGQNTTVTGLTTVNGNGIFNGGSALQALGGGLSIAGNGTFKTASGAGNVTTSNLTLAGNGVMNAPLAMTVTGNWTETDGTLNAGTGTLSFAATGNQTVQSGGGMFNNLVVQGGANLALADNLGAAGNVTIQANGTLSAAGHNAAFGGSWLNQGTFAAGGDTVTFNGSANQNVTSGGNHFNNLVHSGNATLALQDGLNADGTLTNSNGTLNANGQAATISGLTTISAGTYLAGNATQSFGGGLTVNGTFTGSTGAVSAANVINSGNFTAPSTTLTDSGNFTNSGTFSSNGGTVSFSGASNQNLTSGGGHFNNLVHSGNATLALQDALNVDGALTNSNGTLNADGQNATVTGTTTVSSGSTYLAGGAQAFNGGLTANGTFTGGTGAVSAGGVTIGSGANFTAPSSTLTDPGDFTNSGTFTANGGTISFSGSSNQNLTSGGGHFNNLTHSGSATLMVQDTLNVDGALTNSNGTLNANGQNITVGGNWTNGATFLPGGDTVTFNGAGTQNLDSGGSAFNNLSHSGAGTLKLTGHDLTVNGALVNSNGTLNANGQNITAGGNWTNSATFSAGSGTVFFDATGTQNLTSGGSAFHILVVQDSPITNLSLQDDLTVGSDLTIQPNGTLTANGHNITLGGNWLNQGTFAPGGDTVTFSGSANQNLTSGSSHFSNFVHSGSATLALQDGLNADGTLTNSNGTLNANGRSATISGLTTISAGTYLAGSATQSFGGLTVNGTFTGSTGAMSAVNVINSGNFTAPSTTLTDSGSFTNSGTFSPNGGTVSFSGASNQNLTSGGGHFNHLVHSGSATLALQDALNVDGALTNNNGTLNANGQNAMIGGNWTNSASFLAGSGTVTFSGAGTQRVTSGGSAFHIFKVSDPITTTVVLQDTLSTTDVIIAANGALNANGFDVTFAGNWSNAGSFTPAGDTVTFAGNAAQTLDAGSSSFNNLAVNGGSLGNLSLTGHDLAVTHNLSIGGGALSAGARNLTVGGNWSDGGTFNAGTGTVTLNGTGQSISGNTTFYNLGKSVSTADTLTFQAGSNQTVTNALTLQGISGQNLSLRSSSPGTQWIIDPTGSRGISFVDVQDSNNTSGITINASQSHDSGNNTNWNFVTLVTSEVWTGAVDNNWDNYSNWDQGVVPTATIDVTIPIVAHEPVLHSNSTTQNLTLQAGANLTLAGQNLTVTGTFTTLLGSTIDPGTHGSLSIPGSLTGNLTFTGPVGMLTIGGNVPAGDVITTPSMNDLQVGGNLLGMVNVTGLLGIADVGGNAAVGSIAAHPIDALGVGGVVYGNGTIRSALNASSVDAANVLAGGSTVAPSNGTLLVDPAPAATQAVFLTGTAGFNSNKLLLSDELPIGPPVLATLTVVQSGGNPVVLEIDFSGDGGSVNTLLPVTNIMSTGKLGDVTLSAPQGIPGNITAPSIFGSIFSQFGPISGTIQTTGDLGTTLTDGHGHITGVTRIHSPTVISGRIIAGGNLVSSVDATSGFSGVLAAQGDFGAIQLDGGGNAVIGTDAAHLLTRFGGLATSSFSGQAIVLGNVFGDLTLGGLSGRIAVKGHQEYNLPAWRIGILGNVTINGAISKGAGLFSAGLIADSGVSSLGSTVGGTHLSVSGAVNGMVGAEGNINYGTVSTLKYAQFNGAGLAGSPSGATIDWIFAHGGSGLTVPADLSTLLADLADVYVSGGNLTHH